MVEYDIWAQVITALFAFGVGYGLYWLQQFRDKRDKKSKSVDSMISEIKDTVSQLEKEKEPIDEIEKTMTFKLNFLLIQTTSFDTMIYSGVFTLFDVKLQNVIAGFYGLVKEANTINLKIIETITTTRDTVNTLYVENVRYLQKQLFEAYSKLKTTAPQLIQFLEKERK